MNRRLAFLTALITLLAAPAGSRAAYLAVFTDPLYMDASPTGEPVHLQQSLADSLGHRLKTFQGVSGTAWSSVLADVDALVIPELESGRSLADSLAPEAKDAIRAFVQSQGKGIIICGDFQSPPVSHATQLLNDLFGFSLEFAGESASAAALDSTAAAGTAFRQGLGVADLPYSDGTYEITTASLPAGSRNLYPVVADSTRTAAFATDVGSGRLVYLACDWFETPPPSPQTNVLGSAVIHVTQLQGLRVAVFADSVFVDPRGELPNLTANLDFQGHTLTPFTGVASATWRAALQQADVLVIPEQERASLVAQMDSSAQAVLRSFVVSGGGLVVAADGATRSVALLNGIFSTTLAASGGADGTLNGAGAAGTPFEFGPRVLPASNLVTGVTTASLPAGSAALYVNGAVATAFRMTRGLGKVVYLGFDYFEFNPAPFAWRTAADHAVRYVAPPDLAVTAPPVAPGATAQVTCDLSGFTGLTLANVRFREGGSAPFLTTALAQTGPNTWAATIPGSSVTNKGLQFFLEFGNGSVTGTSPNLADALHTHNLPVTLTDFPVASLAGGAYALRGVPMQAANPSAQAVFDELGAYDRKKWRYGTFNGSTYAEADGGARAATPGQGFWIVAKNAAGIATNGTTTDLSAAVELTLSPGFNQIANPFNFPVDFADVVRPADVENNLIGFDGSSYVNNVAALVPGQGYWIKNNASSTRTISIPPLGAGVAPAPPALRTPAPDWALRVDAVAGPFADRGNVFGARRDAADGRDPFDLSEPPPAPAGWVRVAFATPDEGELLADWRPAGQEGATWQVAFSSDQSGKPFTIRLTPEVALPEGWDVVAYEGARAVDLGADRSITGTVGYTTAPRTFTVSAGSAEFLGRVRANAQRTVTEFAMGSPFPNPAWAGVSVDLALPHAVPDASVQVFDVGGRVVRTLARGAMDAGIHRIAWDGRDDAGRRTAAGVYFVKSRADRFTATKKVVLLP